MKAVSEAFSEDLELSKLKAAHRINELVSEVITRLIAFHSVDFLSALQIDRYPITTCNYDPVHSVGFPATLHTLAHPPALVTPTLVISV